MGGRWGTVSYFPVGGVAIQVGERISESQHSSALSWVAFSRPACPLVPPFTWVAGHLARGGGGHVSVSMPLSTQPLGYRSPRPPVDCGGL